MSERRPPSPPRRSRTPLWVIEGLDIARLRSTPLRLVVLLVCVAGVVLSLLLPDLVPPTPLVGAAVAVAALLLGLAVAVAIDAADLTIRGPRHVRAAGGELVAILPVEADPDRAAPLAAAVLDARDNQDKRLLLGLAAAGRDARRCAAWTDAIAVALARTGASVLRVDLASGRSERPGLVEVVREGRKLPSVVSFEPGLRLARIGAGRDHAGAIEVLPTLPTRLPRDLDVLLVALPTAASRQVVTATQALDHLLVVAERDTTSRIDLIAGLDGLDAAGLAAQVALLDDRTAARLAPPAPVAQPSADPRGSEDDDRSEQDAVPSEVDDGVAGDQPAAETPDAAALGTASLGTAAPLGAASLDTAPPDAASSPEPAGASAPDPAGASGPDPSSTEAASPEPRVVAAPSVGQQASSPADDPAPTQDPAEGPLERSPEVDDDLAGDDREPHASLDVPDSGIRLLPGASPRAAEPSPDLRPISVTPRDVDVMVEAAAARAEARADTDEHDLPPIADRVVPDPATPPAQDAPTSPPEGSWQPERPSTASSFPAPVDVTDELPRLGPDDLRPHERRERRDTDEDRDDLRTTAQLAVLLDDLETRDDGS
jgi:hypothetical protein